jgi:phosphoadenosine phosphosulfate reductase
MGIEQLTFLPNIDGKSLQYRIATKEEVSIARLQLFEPPEGYHFCNSGGKDSRLTDHLLVLSGCKHDSHYNNTTCDPPELVRFVFETWPDIIVDKPLETMWQLVARKGLPRRNARFCCEYLKEHSGAGRVVVTGVRWQESWRRRRRSMTETCRWVKAKSFLHPIIDWTTQEVWAYLKSRQLSYCSLYDEGATGPYKGNGYFKRLGCVLCPMTTAKQAQRDMQRWPKIAANWYRAWCHFFEKGSEGVQDWATPDEGFQWWLSRKSKKAAKDNGQHSMFI